MEQWVDRKVTYGKILGDGEFVVENTIHLAGTKIGHDM